jgi:hypothetical protein
VDSATLVMHRAAISRMTQPHQADESLQAASKEKGNESDTKVSQVSEQQRQQKPTHCLIAFLLDCRNRDLDLHLSFALTAVEIHVENQRLCFGQRNVEYLQMRDAFSGLHIRRRVQSSHNIVA